MASIHADPRGTGKWLVRWRDANGDERTKSFPTKAKAEAYRIKIDNGKLTGIEYDPKSGEIPFRDCAALWLSSRPDLKPRTARGHRAILAPAGERKGNMRTLGVDAVLGGYPVNRITRELLQDWVNDLIAAKKAASTIRHQFTVVRQVLEQAMIDRRISFNPAIGVALPKARSANGKDRAGVVDDPSQFLTAEQAHALTDAMPWPFNVYVHLAVWSGLRAGELCALTLNDLELPSPTNRPGGTKSARIHVRHSLDFIDGQPVYDSPKTIGSIRKVPLTAETTEILRDYLADRLAHIANANANANSATKSANASAHKAGKFAPLFPSFKLSKIKPTGVALVADPESTTRNKRAKKETVAERDNRRINQLASATVEQTQSRLELDWSMPLAHMAFYGSIFRPAIVRANALIAERPETYGYAPIDLGVVFHSLRHTYASLCIESGVIPMFKIARFMGHSKPSTTETIYAHLLSDDHDDAMSALGAMQPRTGRTSDQRAAGGYPGELPPNVSRLRP